MFSFLFIRRFLHFQWPQRQDLPLSHIFLDISIYNRNSYALGLNLSIFLPYKPDHIYLMTLSSLGHSRCIYFDRSKG